MHITKKNHFIPCFWTAYWNNEYFKLKRENPSCQISARDKKIFVLNLKNNNIFSKKTEEVFFEKNTGIAIITSEKALEYAKRKSPENYEKVKEEYSSDMKLDFENHFSIMEQCYKERLENLILNDSIINDEEKTGLSLLLVYQILRHPNTLNPIEKLFKINGMEKFEMFFSLKERLSDVEGLAKLSIPFLFPKWKIYKLKTSIFPLCDNPVLIKNQHLMFAFAPNIMLEIDLKENSNVIQKCKIKNRISFFKKREFIKRTILNSTKEIVFGDKKLLEKIKKSNTYKKHRANLISRMVT